MDEVDNLFPAGLGGGLGGTFFPPPPLLLLLLMLLLLLLFEDEVDVSRMESAEVVVVDGVDFLPFSWSGEEVRKGEEVEVEERGVLYEAGGIRRGVDIAVDSCAGRLNPLIPLSSRRFGVERGRVECSRLLGFECGEAWWWVEESGV